VLLRADRRLRALAVGAGVVAPRTVHSDGEAALLADLARGRRRVVQIGVSEGASATLLCAVLDPGAELHLIDPFVRQPNARREGAAATEWATRRVVGRAARGGDGPRVQWHVDFSANVADRWTLPIDLVSIDGDQSEIGVTKDWDLWHPFVVEGGAVLFHDARAVVDRLFRGPRALPDWQIADEVDRAVALRYAPRAA
jgi:predicted O-methyltransferase YrrM